MHAERSVPDSWAAYAAAAAAWSFAMVSVYWALGGTAGLDTLGGGIEELARARDPLILGANGAATVLKVLGGVLALALVRPWGRRLPRWLLLGAAWGGAGLLILYGALQTAGVALVALGVLDPAEPVDPRVLRWRLLLWEPWFLVWGILLAIAARRASSPRSPAAPVDPRESRSWSG